MRELNVWNRVKWAEKDFSIMQNVSFFESVTEITKLLKI